MRKKEVGNRIEVKAVITEVLGARTDIIYDGGFYRDLEREHWMERREIIRGRDRMGCGHSRHILQDREDLDEVLPRRDYYVENTSKVRVCYTVDGQEYERETARSDTNNAYLAGTKIYVTIDPARPDEFLQVSRYKSGCFADDLLIYGMLALMVLCLIGVLFLPYL